MNIQWFSVVCWLGFGAIACASTDHGNSGDPGTPGNSSQLCEEQFDAMEKKCPVGADSKDANVEDCQAAQQNFAGIGCLAQFDSWLSCTATNPRYDCTTDSGCETSQGSYFSCQSQAVQRTGCVRLGGNQDATRCSDSAKPYAFSCLSGAPASCVQVVSEGAGIWCCPQL